MTFVWSVYLELCDVRSETTYFPARVFIEPVKTIRTVIAMLKRAVPTAIEPILPYGPQVATIKVLRPVMSLNNFLINQKFIKKLSGSIVFGESIDKPKGSQKDGLATGIACELIALRFYSLTIHINTHKVITIFLQANSFWVRVLVIAFVVGFDVAVRIRERVVGRTIVLGV